MGSGELVISPEVRTEIARALGMPVLSPNALLRAVRDLVQDRDGMEREFADMQEERNAARTRSTPSNSASSTPHENVHVRARRPTRHELTSALEA
jgi:hypothetical protein